MIVPSSESIGIHKIIVSLNDGLLWWSIVWKDSMKDEDSIGVSGKCIMCGINFDVAFVWKVEDPYANG